MHDEKHDETRDTSLEELMYPIGRVEMLPATSPEVRSASIDELRRYPAVLRSTVEGLSDAQLDTPYRPGGWTVRQVVHHLPDSHMNSYVRFKWATTEDNPTIRTYEEARWAELDEARTGPIDMSLDLLEALHTRWCAFLATLTDAEWEKTFEHPEWGRITLDATLQQYVWHSRHHLAHIAGLIRREGW